MGLPARLGRASRGLTGRQKQLNGMPIQATMPQLSGEAARAENPGVRGPRKSMQSIREVDNILHATTLTLANP